MVSRTSFLAALIAVSVWIAAPIQGDEIEKVNGVRLKGEVIKETPDVVTVRLTMGGSSVELRIKTRDIHKITIGEKTRVLNEKRARKRRTYNRRKTTPYKRGGSVVKKSSKSGYKRPTAEQALAFLKTLPPVGRKSGLVQLWQDKTADDIKTMKTLQFGGHVKGGAHLHMKGDDWKYITAFESLEVGNLFEIDGADDRAFYHLSHLPQSVHTLKVESADELTSKGLKHLRSLKNLKELMVGWSAKIDDSCLVAISSIPSLEVLNVSGCPQITGTGIPYLVKLKNLKVLRMSMSALRDAALVNLSRLNIEELNLSKPPGWVKNAKYYITFNGIKGLLQNKQALPKLKLLHLKNVKFSGQQKQTLKSLRPNLTIQY